MEQLQPKSEISYIKYQEIIEPTIIKRIKQKYQSDINLLTKEGFDKVYFFRERTASLGFITNFPLFFIMLLKGEILAICKSLSLCVYHPVAFNAEYGTFALISATKGMKFYTGFKDGDWAVSKKPQVMSYDVLGDSVHHYTYDASLSANDAWEFHNDKLAEWMTLGKQINIEAQSEDYIIWSHQSDLIDLKSTRAIGTLWIYFPVFFLLVALSRFIVNMWIHIPNWIYVCFYFLPFIIPVVLVRLYANQFGDLPRSIRE